jgi:hypothetical protein
MFLNSGCMQEVPNSSGANGCGEEQGSGPSGADALDAFMEGVGQEAAAQARHKLEYELRLTREQISQTESLLDIADPDKRHRQAKKQRAG